MRLLLVGGGHAHAIALREFARSPLSSGVHATLVSPSPYQTYSGMLPGLVAGHYARAECEIDLARLALASGTDFAAGSVSDVDLGANEVTLADGVRIRYDVLSVNAGSLPNFAVAPGAERWAIPVKPLDTFLAGWEKIRAAAREQSVSIAIVGAGTAGVEIAMAMAHSLGKRGRVTLFSDKAMFSAGASKRIAAALERANVSVREATPVNAVEAGPILMAGGKRNPFDFAVWTAGAAAPPWFRDAGLAVDPAGFILVDDDLRSVSHKNVFAAGDSATLRSRPHAKSGVYAIRQGDVLRRNLRHAAAGEPLEAYVPQRRSLALISTGEHYAIATYGRLSMEGAWLWRWKDRIDRGWMRSFA